MDKNAGLGSLVSANHFHLEVTSVVNLLSPSESSCSCTASVLPPLVSLCVYVFLSLVL